MFEKFTQAAVNVVLDAQVEAIGQRCKKIYPEFFLLGILNQKNSYASKMLKSCTDYDGLKSAIFNKFCDKTSDLKVEYIKFSLGAKNILKQALDFASERSKGYVMPEHILLAILESGRNYAAEILTKFNFDIEKNKSILYKLIQKKKTNCNLHPENFEFVENEDIFQPTISSIFEEFKHSDIFSSAISKLSASNYEIMGTEQLMQSILENENSVVSKVFRKFDLDDEKFSKCLSEVNKRDAEFEEKQIVFTPNALKSMIKAFDIAKELGSSRITSEHIVLGILSEKKGVAYQILKELGLDTEKIEDEILKKFQTQHNQTTTVLKLAQEEANNLSQQIVGSEHLLIGILAEGTSIAAKVLMDLGVTLKDARLEAQKLVDETCANTSAMNLVLSNRAKKILNLAFEIAKKQKLDKILPEHILLAMTSENHSIGMKILNNLGVDALEIRSGIQQKKIQNI